MDAAPTPWRTGRSVGRTLYDAGGDLIGVLDTRQDAACAVAAVNLVARLGFLAVWLDLENTEARHVAGPGQEAVSIVNTGMIELACAAGDGGLVDAKIFYSPTTGAIVNTGSPGRAFEVTNTAGAAAPVVVTGPTGQQVTASVPAAGVTRTAAQLAAIGITTRAQVSGFSLSSP